MDGHDHRDLVDIGGQLREGDLDLLVIAVTLAGAIVALVDDRAAGDVLVVVEAEVHVAADLAARVAEERRGVEVEILTIGRAHVPAEADHDAVEAGCFLREADIATLRQ